MADDARNTLFKRDNTQRIPGEFELLQAILPGALRLYMGTSLNFKEPEILSACQDVYNFIFDTNLPAPIIDDSATKAREKNKKQPDIPRFIEPTPPCGCIRC